MKLTLDISNYEYVRLNNPSLKYQRFTPSGCRARDIGIRKFEFVAKTHFLIFFDNGDSTEYALEHIVN